MWFFLVEGQVNGPLAMGQLEDRLQGMKTENPPLIWWRGQKEWVSVSAWREYAHSLKDADEKNRNLRWDLKLESETHTQLVRDDLLAKIEGLDKKSTILIKPHHESEWKSVFEMPTIMDELGMGRRKHLRVPIQGVAEFYFDEKNDSIVYQSKLTSISEGGFGIIGTHHLAVGDTSKMVLKSDLLSFPIHCRAQLMYISKDGYGGFQFENISTEHQSTILMFINQFKEAHPDKTFS